MAKNKKIVRYRKPFHLNIGLIIFGIILIYLMFYIYSYFTSTHISVYEVIYGTIAVNNSYTGLALRSEEIVLAEHSGEINYYRKEASKAGIGDLIYSIDSDGTIAGAINSADEDTISLNKESWNVALFSAAETVSVMEFKAPMLNASDISALISSLNV